MIQIRYSKEETVRRNKKTPMLYLNLIVDGSRKQLVAGVIESHRGDLVGVVDGVGRASLPYVPHLVFGGRKGLIN